MAPVTSILFFANFLILFGPTLILGMQQIKGYEPGDADWGVKMADVRGQAEAKEEITRVVSLWQSGEEFEKAGGKRERGETGEQDASGHRGGGYHATVTQSERRIQLQRCRGRRALSAITTPKPASSVTGAVPP